MKIQNERERERINKVKKEYRNIVKKNNKMKESSEGGRLDGGGSKKGKE